MFTLIKVSLEMAFKPFIFASSYCKPLYFLAILEILKTFGVFLCVSIEGLIDSLHFHLKSKPFGIPLV